MNTLRVLRALGSAGIGSLMSISAFAQQEGGYYYGGASAGQSRVSIDSAAVTSRQLGPGVSATAMSSDDRDTAYKVFGGYQINRNFALEGGYFDLGKYGVSATTTPIGTLNGEIKSRGLNLDVVGTLPFTEKFSGLARVGVIYAKTDASFSGTGAAVPTNPNASSNGTNYKFGVGLQYALNSSVWLRSEVERHHINATPGDHANVDVISVGLVFPFGRTDAPAKRMADASYMAPAAPMPHEVVSAPLAARARHSVKISAETLFTFDKSDLRPEGKAALDAFAKDIKGSRFETVTVVGHADRLGTTAYNQTLSQQRAEVVKAYLVSTDGLNGAKIAAVGKSENEPVTLPEDCKGSKPTPVLIACLQPDRGVEIEMSGSR